MTKSKNSEKILTAILKLSEDLDCSLFDAMIEYCSINDLEIEEVVERNG